jgi:hypothetical protein
MKMRTFAMARLLSVLTVSSLGVVGVGAATASAAPPSATPSGGGLPPGAPTGCDSGHFCGYIYGDGGSWCFETSHTTNYPWPCWDDTDSSYNNQTVNVELFSEYNETGAFYLLGAGDYLLYMDQNNFNRCLGGGTSCENYGEQMENEVMSIYVP